MFEHRKIVVIGIMSFVALMIAIRLFYVQILDDKYKLSAESNSRRKEVQYPSRGLIFDRNGKLLVSNQAVYDIMIVPREVHEFDSIDFCNTVGISMETLRELFAKVKTNLRYRRISAHKPSLLSSSFLGRDMRHCKRSCINLEVFMHSVVR